MLLHTQQRLQTVPGLEDSEPAEPEKVLEDLAGLRVVVDHEGRSRLRAREALAWPVRAENPVVAHRFFSGTSPGFRASLRPTYPIQMFTPYRFGEEHARLVSGAPAPAERVTVDFGLVATYAWQWLGERSTPRANYS